MAPEARRAAIIDSVLPLLVARGSSVTTRQIAEAAGVSEGTIFNAFDDKDALIAAAIEQALDQTPFERSVAAIDPTLPFDARLVRATELMQVRTVGIWQLVSQFGPPRPERAIPTSPALIEMFASMPGRVRIPPAEAARALRALALALTHPMLVATPASPDHIVDVFLNGVVS